MAMWKPKDKIQKSQRITFVTIVCFLVLFAILYVFIYKPMTIKNRNPEIDIATTPSEQLYKYSNNHWYYIDNDKLVSYIYVDSYEEIDKRGNSEKYDYYLLEFDTKYILLAVNESKNETLESNLKNHKLTLTQIQKNYPITYEIYQNYLKQNIHIDFVIGRNM